MPRRAAAGHDQIAHHHHRAHLELARAAALGHVGATCLDAADADELDTALYAALATGTFLSDDPYVDLAPNLGSGAGIYVPTLSIGRLVETPSQVVDQLAGFTAAGGQIRTDSGSVLGYDFLLDSAEETA